MVLEHSNLLMAEGWNEMVFKVPFSTQTILGTSDGILSLVRVKNAKWFKLRRDREGQGHAFSAGLTLTGQKVTSLWAACWSASPLPTAVGQRVWMSALGTSPPSGRQALSPGQAGSAAPAVCVQL